MRITIIGGGLSGLGAGFRLSQEGHKVTILEKNDHVGGMASSYLIDGYYIPKTYHHIMSGDSVTLGLIEELDLQEFLYWKKLKTGFFYDNECHDFSSPLSILKFKPLSFMDRIRFAFLVLKARRRNDWMYLDNVNIKEWVIENYGTTLYENLIKHIVIDKFDESPENISVAWLLSRFGHESKSVSGRFGYLRNGGVQSIIQGLVESIVKLGGDLKIQADVKKIELNEGKAIGVVYGEDEQFINGDVVISTIPIPILLKALPELPKRFKERLRKINYKACLCLTLGLKKKISSYYWLNIIGDYPFVGVFEHRHLNIDPLPAGILYLVKYLDTNHHNWRQTDDEIFENYTQKLEEIFPAIRKEILWFRIYREPFSTPIYSVSFAKNMPEIRSPIENFYITGISCIYPKDRYMGTALGSGFYAAQTVIQDYKLSDAPK